MITHTPVNDREAADQVVAEITRARTKFPPFHSAHEGYAVLLEEVRELEAEVFKNEKIRDPQRLQDEARQVAAMAIRFMVDVGGSRQRTVNG